MYQITKEKYYDNLKEHYPNDDFTILEFTNTKQPVSIQCNKCGQIFNYKCGATLYSKKRKHFCPLCNSQSVISMREACEKENIAIINISFNVTEKWELKCNKCGKIFYRAPSTWEQKTCPNCGHTANLYTKEKRQQMVDDWFGKGEFEVLSDGPATRYFLIKHKCGFIRKTQFFAFMRSNGCPKCSKSMSKGEQKIMDYFDTHNIDYVYQKKLEHSHQTFDFYLPNYFLAIEFNGIQHYQPIEIFGGQKRYEEQKLYDLNKEKYCKENNITLKTISYKDYDRIDTILTELLKKFNDQSKDVGEN